MSDNSKGLMVFDPNKAVAQIDDNEVKGLVQRVDTAAMWPRDCTPQQKMTIARLSLAYGLDPMLGELTIYQGKPWITIDGRLRLAHNSGKFQGIVEDRPATAAEYEALHVDPKREMLWYCSVKHADWIKPNGRFGRAKLDGDKNPIVGVGKAVPPDVQARKRALWSALRDPWQMKLPGVYEDAEIAVERSAAMDPDEPQELHASKGQVAAIHALVKQMEWSDNEYRRLLNTRFGVASSSELTGFQAADLLDELGEAAERQQYQRDHAAELQGAADVFGDQLPPEPEPEPEPTEQPTQGKPFCCSCGVEIKEETVGRTVYTVDDIVRITTRTYNEPLCASCYNERRKKKAS